MCRFPKEQCCSRQNALIIIEAIPLCALEREDGRDVPAIGPECETCVLCLEERLPLRGVAALGCDEAASLVEEVTHVRC